MVLEIEEIIIIIITILVMYRINFAIMFLWNFIYTIFFEQYIVTGVIPITMDYCLDAIKRKMFLIM